MKKLFGFILIIVSLAMAGCQDKKPVSTVTTDKKLVIITTLFPLYDFARTIAGDKAEVTLLLPPGVEAHSFEPRPDDVVKIAKAGLFIYTNKFMEPWAEKFISGLNSTVVTVVDASKGITLQPARSKHHQADQHKKGADAHHHHHHPAMDPHIWLDLGNAQLMVDTIAATMSAKDPANSATYAANTTALKQQLTQLDTDFRSGLSQCGKKTFLHGGHYAFGYLSNRYDLQYESAISVNANAEPNPARMIELIKQVKSSGLKYVFSEEMVSPRLTEAIARETGAKVLSLHNLHNVSKDDLQSGAGYISLMRKNLANLKTGLECR
ncbi:MAG: zinc ABC transporter substrate-binding protein [Trichlorobacter sp.]|uniref:metal ABC transporter solute-binding protein, Zn/Mn family n=1 Tax=Trichlorobacter sp. TaxID=2911007 RepID=UPI002560D6A9|nr:zinc ABC transporter substrate-binding protein [Trichlorobacter sp.]MDK9719168.1 zinc ABC transporter substrate-binding protein [Trichlorobacter sp.]